jgi:hypothetical protein
VCTAVAAHTSKHRQPPVKRPMSSPYGIHIADDHVYAERHVGIAVGNWHTDLHADVFYLPRDFSRRQSSGDILAMTLTNSRWHI